MNDQQWKYLFNLTDAYDDRSAGGKHATRRMYSINVHGLMDKKFGGKEYYSQEYQDFVVDNLIFHHMENGVFLDIGANDPIFINNTYFLEKERGWTGLAFEPLESLNKKWSLRKTECMQVALGKVNGVREYTEYLQQYDYMSGFSSVVDFDGPIKDKYKVQVRKLGEILEEKNITHVDYVSLDVEGAEIEVLQGIDFNKCDFTCFMVELEEREETFEVRKFFIENGYCFLGRLWHDDIWIKEGFFATNSK